jgi:L-aminopeptidase/D-esterase-like protein
MSGRNLGPEMAGTPDPSTRLIRVKGLRVGHATEAGDSTGVTVALFRPAAAMVADVRGGASCTYDIASLSVEATFGRRWAVFFAGGSVYGLDAARGIRTGLLSAGIGTRPFRNPNRVVQIAGATLFDLPSAEGPVADYLPIGFEAVRNAREDRVEVGPVGAGAGATVGKYLGREHAMRGGIGYASARMGKGGSTGALVALNSVGAVRDPGSGRWVAGARNRSGRIVPPIPLPRSTLVGENTSRGTNLILVVTDTPLSRGGLYRLAQQAHDGLARAVMPAHTATDGDVAFAATTEAGRRPERELYPGQTADRVGTLAADLVARAAVLAVRPGGP